MNLAAALAEMRAVMDRLEPEPQHTLHVAHLSVRIFDALSPLHRLGSEERVLLEGAAWLHDIGWPVSHRGSGHHKLSAKLIRKQSWRTLNRIEVELLALVARYHRRALPCSEHVDFHRLPTDEKRVIRILGAILRLGDAFDRSHLQHVHDVSVRLLRDSIEFTLLSPIEPVRELEAAEKKGNLAREVLSPRLEFRHERARVGGTKSRSP